MRNIVFIDGQNLHLGTQQDNWSIDYSKFVIYLKENYEVSQIYYFIGYKSEKFDILYRNLELAGLMLMFKDHHIDSQTKKKGNVDTDIVFEVMKQIIDNLNFDKVILISGDGDYKKLVDYLISKDKFIKILFPNKRFVSSLYKTLSKKYIDYLQHIKEYIEYK